MIEALTWVAGKASLKKGWALCRKYWQILLGISIPIIFMLVFRKKADLSKVLDRAREDHQKEVDAINNAHQSEIEARDQAQKRYFDTIRQLEEKYESCMSKTTIMILLNYLDTCIYKPLEFYKVKKKIIST